MSNFTSLISNGKYFTLCLEKSILLGSKLCFSDVQKANNTKHLIWLKNFLKIWSKLEHYVMEHNRKLLLDSKEEQLLFQKQNFSTLLKIQFMDGWTDGLIDQSIVRLIAQLMDWSMDQWIDGSINWWVYDFHANKIQNVSRYYDSRPGVSYGPWGVPVSSILQCRLMSCIKPDLLNVT